MQTAALQEPLVRIAGMRPMRVCEGIEVSELAREALADDPTPTGYLTTLLVAESYDDAVRFLAHALPRADAVRWACECARAGRDGALPPAAEAALAAARRWAATQHAQHCRDAADAAEAEGMKNEGAARFAALAAAWSGESLAPEGLPPAAPAPDLGALAVAASLTIAARTAEPAGVGERYRERLSRGILMARLG
jgi:hypothetical protein